MRKTSHLFLLILSIIYVLPFSALDAGSQHEVSDSQQTMLLNEPSCFVNHSVNVISGDYQENEIDLEVAGPHPLFYQRSYGSCTYAGNLSYHWHTNHFGAINSLSENYDTHPETGDYIDNSEYYAPTVRGDCGMAFPFYGKSVRSKKHVTIITARPEVFNKYITNCPEIDVTGSHLRNTRLNLDRNKHELTLSTGNGYIRHYEYRRDNYESLLEREDQPNGCSIYYTTDRDRTGRNKLKRITLKNVKGEELSSIICDPLPKNALKPKNIDPLVKTIYGSDGRWVRYQCKEFRRLNSNDFNYLWRVEGSDIPTQTYEYTDLNLRNYPKIARKNLPDGRFLSTQYYKGGSLNYVGDAELSLGAGDARVGRVSLQLAPVGTDSTPIITHRYFYDLRTERGEGRARALGGRTTVYDAKNNKIDYDYNDDYRITDITKWTKEATEVYSKEKTSWCHNNALDGTGIRLRTLENGKGEIKLSRFYLYDTHGNAIHRSIWGNLTGKCFTQISFHNDFPIDGTSESYALTSEYTSESPYLLLKEIDTKKNLEYSYKPGSTLKSARYVRVGDKILKREFYDYDINGCLQRITVDDGSAADINILTEITQRRLTCIKNRTKSPVGLPQVIEQKCVDLTTKEEILLGRVINTHSKRGHILTQEHYDSESVLRYTLEWDYDSMGNTIMEKDAIGRIVKKKYDDNRNLIYEEGPYPGVYKEHRYDFVNRLIGTTEVHPDGVRLTCSYIYDYIGNKIAAVDHYGQETRYIYDDQNRLVKTIYPLVLDEYKCRVQPEASIEYDIFNNPSRLIDSSGGVTEISYTAYNKPYHKVYPDGTVEKFEYDLSGNLILSVAQNGTKTTFQYDPFDRLKIKEVYSSKNDLIQTESFDYNTFGLISSTDPSGMVTFLEYDNAGRIFRKTKGDMRTQYEYDTLGRESKILTFYGKDDDQYTAKVQEYDLLDRVIEERTEDSSGQVLIRELYDYDVLGNKNVISKYNQAGESTTRIDYNTRGQPILITDAEGNETRIVYRYDYFDEELQQYLPYSESTAPNGIVTITIKDALNRVKSEFKKDAFNKPIQKRHLFYTQTGLLSRTIDEVIVDGVSQSEIINFFKYDTAGKLIEACEAEGTHEQKITKYTYNKYGQKEYEIKPDGSSILYVYDPLGRLKEYVSSDGSVHYIYDYDLSSNPFRVLDLVNGTETLRKYDEYNRLKRETLGNGLSLEYSYDLSGKPTQINFPDGSGMGLSYDNLFLKEIFRIGKKGERLYSHYYDSYDLSGNVAQSTLIGKAGKVSYTLDLIGRLTGIENSAWSGSIHKFDLIGNVSEKSVKDALGTNTSQYSYDELNQLTKEEGSFYQEYANDSLYNRIRKGKFDYKINGLNQIINDGDTTYKYDLNGNLISIQDGHGEAKLRYDALNRLVEFETGSQKVNYIYDELNRRIGKQISIRNDLSEFVLFKTHNYFYQDQNEIGAYENGKLNELRLLGLGKGAEIGAAIAMEFNDVVYAPIHDLHGNVICLVEADTGDVREFYRYSAYGEESLYDQNNNSINEVINPWRFSSKRTDEETGFVYFGRRYYDSGLGRWITQDPLGYADGPNLYAYVKNNPLINIDLFGLSTVEGVKESGGERSFFSTVRDFAVSIYESVRDTITSVGNCIGESLSYLSNRLSEGFNFYCEQRRIQFSEAMMFSRMNKLVSCSYPVGSGQYTGIGYCNGMCTTENQNWCNAEILSQMANKGKIESTFNPTNGFHHDIMRAFHSLYFYMASNVVVQLHVKWDKHFSMYPNKVWLEICHSEGAINVRNALMCYNRDLCALIDVLAIAPAAYIDKHLCRNVDHYVSTRDFVPMLDIAGRIRNNETTQVLSAHRDANFWDHDFQSPTYGKVIKDHVQRHIRENGY